MKWKCIWYNASAAISIEYVTANTKDEAISKAYEKHNGNGPAPLLTVIPDDGKD